MDSSLTTFPVAPESLPVEDVFADVVTIDGQSFQMAGFVAKHGEHIVTGSAAATGSEPTLRAYMELLERLAILEAEASAPVAWQLLGEGRDVLDTIPHGTLFPADAAPDQQRLSKSNGVAAHSDWDKACRSAKNELIERDRVLRAWQRQLGGCTLPVQLLDFAWAQFDKHYVPRVVQLGTADADGVVVACFAFPVHAGAPMSYGFACRSRVEDAVLAAESECLQRLSFLWGEEIPTELPEPTPTPDFHQEYYLTSAGQSVLRNWLDEIEGMEHRPTPAVDVSFADVTPAKWQGRLFVAKAHAPRSLPLRFGVDAVLGVHPIA